MKYLDLLEKYFQTYLVSSLMSSSLISKQIALESKKVVWRPPSLDALEASFFALSFYSGQYIQGGMQV